ncbi:MAG: glycine C-acetyltransferase [Anaerolineae bacterium]|nr:glycine C-acetyltransferase [Anaerolineae bacterium]MCB9129741.1 glycine C-acetyltransferase [Anaerolineales bacterium]MCB0233896.1 glycine C-acetyltransferase [Anaerolineae bacterium]MCB0239314.1 glycine C-acetyltransferase [Anaerolineae bacterium]MCB0248275.1 glycine C-acetyltransferase [Anaerolineae bacterium]
MTTKRNNQRLGWLADELAQLQEQGRYTNIRTLGSPQGAWLEVDGKKVLNFCSNNYLGLANHPRVTTAARDAIDRFGVGPGAVRTIAGTMTLHEELERKLAEFKRAEAVVTFQSGFSANVGVIPALVGDGDLVISDQLNHASIIDGVRLTKADRTIYEHCNPASLEEVLEENYGQYTRMFVITDGVFSMDGDIAPLPEIVKLAERFGAITVVDDAHGEGVLGKGGRGIVDHFDLHGRVDVEIGTLSKAFGAVGGLAAGSQVLTDWLKQRGRPFLFSSAMTVPDVAACIAAVDLLSESTELVDRLWQNARLFQGEMRRLGFDTGKTQTPITPVMLGDELLAQQFSRRLYEEGVFGTAITFPTVPRGKARIRVMLSAAHSNDDLEAGLQIFARVGKELGVI